MNIIIEDIKRQFQSGSMVTRIIMVNLGFFVFFNLLNLVFFIFADSNSTIFSTILEYFQISTSGFEVLTRPWSIFTHMFLHMGFRHILFNMLYIYWFGQILQGLIGNHRILGIYVLSGLGGALAYFLVANFTEILGKDIDVAHAMGASAAAIGMVTTAATIAPNYEMHLIFLGPVKLLYIALFVVFMNLISIPDGVNTGGIFGHLGGAATGFLLARQIQAGSDWTEWFNNIFGKIIGWLESVFTRRPKPKVVYKNPNKTASKTKSNRRQRPNSSSVSGDARQAKIDAILDKIKVGGYDNLTAEEKEFLFKVRKDI